MAKSNDIILLETRLAEAKALDGGDSTDDTFFQRFAVDGVLASRDISYRELDEGDVDGSDDGGLDGVYIFLNGELVSDESLVRQVDRPDIELELFQVKNEAGFSETALQKLIDHLPLLLSLEDNSIELSAEINDDVLERFGLFRQVYLKHANQMPDLAVRISYVAKASAGPNKKVKAKADRLKAAVKSSFPDATVDVDFVGARDLNQLARLRPTTRLELKLAEQPISGELGGIVGLARLVDYFNFVTDEDGAIREAIFEENVRGYEGNTIINKAIAATLEGGIEHARLLVTE